MAAISKKVCDRCGEPIEMIGWTSKLFWKGPRPHEPTTRIKLLKLFYGNLDGYSYSEEEYELCRECTLKVSQFLRGKSDF